jgi:heme exporter protein A
MRLTAAGLACIRGGRPIFANLGFDLADGGALVVTGPNGAGKTSALRLIAGLLRPAAGEIVFTGGTPDASLAEQTHYIGHQDALKPALSVSENLIFWSGFLGSVGLGGLPSRDALARVGLDRVADLPASFLSAGQRRRLALARLLTVRRPIWLLDEPTAGLDAAAQDVLFELMQTHRNAGGLIVAATHAQLDLRDATALALGTT